MYGFAGVILRINLTTGKIVKQPLPKEWAANFLGGSGINDWILYNEVGPDIEPLSPDNRLIFGVGPLAGILGLGSKIRVTTRSPLTGILGDSTSGGFWGNNLKFAGYDHIVVEGKAEKPCYIWIDDDIVEVKDASHLWRKDVFETDDIIKEDVRDEEASVAAIGPAGENLVKYASIIFNRYRACGRVGAGCVMGSKRLKAIVTRGTKGIKVAKPEKFEEFSTKIREQYLDPAANPAIERLSKYGTMQCIPLYNEIGSHSIRNAQEVQHENISQIDPENVFYRDYSVRSVACSLGCMVHCSHWWKIKEGPFSGEVGEKPEYIICESLGLHLDNVRMDAICHFQNVVNKYGLDCIEAGTAIGLVMELWQRGLISSEETEGIAYEWGDISVIEEALRKIAYRKGIGDLLAEGTLNAARKIGRGAERFVTHSKGMTMVEDVRAFPQWALCFAVSSRGADHLKGSGLIDKNARTDASELLFGDPGAGEPHTPRLKGLSTKFFEEMQALADALGICKLANARLLMPTELSKMMTPKDYAAVYSAATGIELSTEEFARCCERIVVLEKSYNARLGITRKDDTLGERWMKEPCPSGPGKGMKCEDYLDVCLDE
jgi:aldehyde:ferredoxin oxidoreductase